MNIIEVKSLTNDLRRGCHEADYFKRRSAGGAGAKIIFISALDKHRGFIGFFSYYDFSSRFGI